MAKKDAQVQENIALNLTQVTDYLAKHHEANIKAQENGFKPVAVNLMGPAGVGKTSIARALGEKYGIKTIVIDAATITDVGDLLGLPVRYFEVQRDESTKWVPDNVVKAITHEGWHVTGKIETRFAHNGVLANLEPYGVLIIDDYTRANPFVTQGMMPIILEQGFLSFQLPIGWTVVATTNPDNGEYQVATMDAAQMGRMIHIDVKQDTSVWALWAERKGFNDQAINFMLKFPEILNDQTFGVSARSMSLALQVAGDKLTSPEHAFFVRTAMSGSVGAQVYQFLQTFINYGMDKLMPVADFFEKPMPAIVKKFNEDTKSKGNGNVTNVRHDICSIYATRVANFMSTLPQDASVDYMKRLFDILDNDELFTIELKCTIAMRWAESNHPLVKELLKEESMKTKFRGWLFR